MAPPDPLHGRRQARLAFHFVAYADRYGGAATGEAGIHLEVDPDTVLAPDVTYTRAGRLPEDDRRGFARCAPNVAAEIDSASNRLGERRRRVRAYHQAGTQLVHFLDDEKRSLTVEHADGRTEVLHDGDVFDGGEVMPGFRISVADLFR